MGKEAKALALLSVSLFLLIVLNLYTLMIIVPRYVRLYLELGAPLPLLTKISINVGQFVRMNFIFLFPITVVFIIGLIVVPFIIKNKLLLNKIYFVIAASLLLFSLFIHFAIRMPINQLNKFYPEYQSVVDQMKNNLGKDKR